MASVSFPVIGVFMATAIAVAGLYYVRNNHAHGLSERLHSEEQSGYLRIVNRSAAYHFGFANAAVAGCPFSPGTELDRLAESVARDGQWVVPTEVKAGFAEFHNLEQTGACRIAERLFGPKSPARPGVLLPH